MRSSTSLAVLLSAGILIAAAPSTASAALQCDASALRGTVLGAPAIEPVTAGRGGACRSQNAGGAQAAQLLSALPINATILGASTFLTPAGTANEKQAVLASGGLGSVTVTALPNLGLTLPPITLPTGLDSISIPTPALLKSLPVVGLLLPANLTFDLTAAVEALLPNGQLPNVNILEVGAATAYAGASCRDGRFTPFGVSQVGDIKVLGQTLPTDALLASRSA